MEQATEASHLRRQFGVVRAVFRFAVERDYIGRSPCRGIKLPEVEQTSCPVVSGADLERLAVEVGPNHAPMAYLGAVLGLRWDRSRRGRRARPQISRRARHERAVTSGRFIDQRRARSR